jgi:hypothetical protein
MAKKQSKKKVKGETKARLVKKMLFAFEAKRKGSLSAEDFKTVNMQLRASPFVRRPITLFDTDPYDSIITADRDPTDMIHMYDSDPTDRILPRSL